MNVWVLARKKLKLAYPIFRINAEGFANIKLAFEFPPIVDLVPAWSGNDAVLC